MLQDMFCMNFDFSAKVSGEVAGVTFHDTSIVSLAKSKRNFTPVK